MKKLKLLLAITSLPLIVSCQSLYISDYCIKYEPYKITCNKDALKDGKKCSDVISDETIDAHTINELEFQNKCLNKEAL